MRHWTWLVLLTLPVVTGCTAIISTTNTVARGLQQTTDASTNLSDTTTDGSGSDKLADARRFVRSQFVMLRREAAAGGGEHTIALAQLLGLSDPVAFGRWMQRNYQPLFAHLQTHEQLVARIVARQQQPAKVGRNGNA